MKLVEDASEPLSSEEEKKNNEGDGVVSLQFFRELGQNGIEDKVG